jgi:uncharacterized RDD family membrane protein YckC
MQIDLLDNIIDDNPKISQKRLRVAASVIDFIIIWFVGFILGFFFGTYTAVGKEGSYGYQLSGYPALVWVLFWFILFPISEGITSQTIGKRILKIKVVKANYEKTTLISSFIRHLFDIIDVIFLVGLIVAALNKKNKRIGDFVANTIVVLKTQ